MDHLELLRKELLAESDDESDASYLRHEIEFKEAIKEVVQSRLACGGVAMPLLPHIKRMERIALSTETDLLCRKP